MKREILFRGFHACEDGTEQIRLNGEVIKGKWVFGYFWTNEAGNCFIKVIRDLNGNFVGKPTTNDYEVFPETVGQFTGLNDKKGIRIFEGDILQLCKATYPCLVYWNGTGWSIERNGKRVIYACDMDIAHDLRNMEVIGTKFDDCLYKKPDGLCLRESDSESNIYIALKDCVRNYSPVNTQTVGIVGVMKYETLTKHC